MNIEDMTLMYVDIAAHPTTVAQRTSGETDYIEDLNVFQRGISLNLQASTTYSLTSSTLSCLLG